MGAHHPYITAEMMEQYLDAVREGFNPQEAAEQAGQTATQFRAIRSPKSKYYDEDFAAQFREAYKSTEYEESRLERIRCEILRRALRDSDRLLEKLAVVYDPDWAFMRHKSVEITGSLDTFVQQHFGHLSSAQLQQIVEWAEGPKELQPPSGLLPEDEVVDAEDEPPADEAEAA